MIRHSLHSGLAGNLSRCATTPQVHRFVCNDDDDDDDNDNAFYDDS